MAKKVKKAAGKSKKKGERMVQVSVQLSEKELKKLTAGMLGGGGIIGGVQSDIYSCSMNPSLEHWVCGGFKTKTTI